MDLDPVEDRVDRTLAISATTTDSIYQSSPESDSKGGGEVYLVGNREGPKEKIVEEV
jgi:hypothetical protein